MNYWDFTLWDSISVLDFQDWIQQPEVLIPFFKAVNERLWVTDDDWLKYTEAVEVGETIPYTTGTISFSVDSIGTYRFPEDPDLLKTYPGPTNPGHSYWNTGFFVETAAGMQAVDPLVNKSPDDYLIELCTYVYKFLPQFFIATHDPDGVEINNLNNIPYIVNPNYVDDYTTDVISNTILTPAPSIEAVFTTGTGLSKVWNFPRPGGPDAYRTRAICNLDIPGASGQVARILAAFLPDQTGPWEPEIIANSGRLAVHDGTNWIIKTIDEEITLGLEPDVIHEQRLPAKGDLLGPWILRDLIISLNMMRKTWSWSVREFPSGTIIPANQTSGSGFFTGRFGKSKFVFFDEDYPDTLPPATITRTKDWNDPTFYSPTDIVVSGEGAFTSALISKYPSVAATTNAGGGGIFNVENIIESDSTIVEYYPTVYINKSVERPVVAHSPILQEQGIGRKITPYLFADRRYNHYATRLSRMPPSPWFNRNQWDIDSNGTGITVWDGMSQPYLWKGPTTDVEIDAAVVMDYLSDIEVAPTAFPEGWEPISNSGGAAKGINAGAYGAVSDWAVVGGFRYSHLTT